MGLLDKKKQPGLGQAGAHERILRSQDDAAAEASSCLGRNFSAAELGELAELGADWLWESDSNHRFTWLSDGFEVHTGTDPKSVIGRPRTDFAKHVPHSPSSVEEHIATLEARQPFSKFIYEVANNNEHCRWVSVSGVPRFDENGDFIGYRGIGRNATRFLGVLDELTHARRTLSLQESRQKALEGSLAGENHVGRLLDALEATRDAFCYYDADDRAVIYNRALLDIYAGLEDIIRPGVTFDAIVRAGVERDLWDTDGLGKEEWLQQLAEMRASQSELETILRFRDGRCVMHREKRIGDGGTIGMCTDITEHKKREEELAHARSESEGLLSDLERTMDAMRMGIVVFDEDLNAQMINTACRRIWKAEPGEAPKGISARQVMEMNRKKGFFNVADAEWETYVATRLNEIRNGDLAPYELTWADGRTMIYAVTSLSGGRRLVTYYDVTELKQREAQLAEALEKSKLAEAVIDGIPNPIFVKNEAMEFVLVNKAFARMTGVEAHEMLGATAFDFSPEDLAEHFEQSERHVLQTGEDYEAEVDDHHPGIGRYRIVRKHKVLTESGTAYIAGNVFDITDVKRRENEAQEARQRLAEVLESLPAGVIIYDSDDRFVLANRKVHDALPAMVPAMETGRALREAVEAAHAAGYFRESGDPALDSLYDTDPQGWTEGYLARYQARQHVFERRNPDGRWFKVFDTRTKDGTFVGVRVDITELKEREQELCIAQEKAVLADRAKSEFLANMSHEIRTPMNGVLGMAELLAKTELEPKQKTFADIILKSGNALLTIINDILDFSKIDAGQLVLDPQPFNLAEAIEDVATLVSSRAREKDLELIVRVDPCLPGAVVGDVGRLRQIVTNLLGNAVKFTERGHVLVDVSGVVSDDETELYFSVADTGVGIPKDKLGLVFEKFSQVDASSTRQHEGTGLGLAITARLVELMGGAIEVESEEGEGSTFRFSVTLPNGEAPEKRPAPPADVSGAKILVVDDSPVNRTILSEQMACWGFDACAASSGPEGLKVLEAAAHAGVAVECVVLDYQMPGMNGMEVAQAIRANEAYTGMPIVMLTSVDQSLSSTRHHDFSIEAQLIKPARSSVLLETLVELIQRRRAGDDAGAGHPRSADRNAQESRSAPSTDKTAFSSPPTRPKAHAFSSKSSPDQVDILVAEDNEVNQLVFSQILAETDFRFEIVSNGRLAVDAHKAIKPRMILMDVSMPQMNGLEATAEIRKTEAQTGCHVPIVGVTAHALKGDRERCLDAGMDDYLSKPISPKALLEKIDIWMSEEDGAAYRNGAS